jgi:NAD-dependent dihydropyrimidine dehydrogenase PreA subunit
MIRKIVQIDEEKCDGCGLCVPSCAEGAISIVDGKARLAADNLCDGLGACLGDCPRDAIKIIEREADEFDESAVEKHLETVRPQPAGAHHPAPAHAHGGCPGSRVMALAPKPSTAAAGPQQSRLAQWPVQLHLVPPTAPFLQNADLLIAADCVAFAHGGFHDTLLDGKALLIACPKLDDTGPYREKLAAIFRSAGIKSVTVARMEVPCCGGIVQIARQALEDAGKEIPFTVVTVGIGGDPK